MSKKNSGGIAETMNGVTITINQHLHGIEVKGNVSKKDDKWLRENGFWFSKRKGHYWTPFESALYEKVIAYFKGEAKSKSKAKTKAEPKAEEKQITMAEAAPIDITGLFENGGEPAPKKSKAKKAEPKKTEAKKPAKKADKKEEAPAPATSPVTASDDLNEWKRKVIRAVEKILDESIATMLTNSEVTA